MKFNPGRSSGNIQSEFYHRCALMGLKCFVEYQSRWNGVRGCRFDVVVHCGGIITAIVEIKDSKRTERYHSRWGKSKQCGKYSKFGVPVFLITRVEEINGVINIILSTRGKPTEEG